MRFQGLNALRRGVRQATQARHCKRSVVLPTSLPDFGDYDIILPPEPYVWGVSHIHPRPVPDGIARPTYALRGDHKPECAALDEGFAFCCGPDVVLCA